MSVLVDFVSRRRESEDTKRIRDLWNAEEQIRTQIFESCGNKIFAVLPNECDYGVVNGVVNSQC